MGVRTSADLDGGVGLRRAHHEATDAAEAVDADLEDHGFEERVVCDSAETCVSAPWAKNLALAGALAWVGAQTG